MEKNKVPMFTFIIITIILGVTLIKQFDFENLKFENTGLAIVYLVVFISLIYMMIKDLKKKKQQPTSRD
jgi:fucose 4-O-acetylase-like acetyltransferase